MRSAVSEILALSDTNNHFMVKVLGSHFFPILTFDLKKHLNLLAMSQCFYAFSCCHMIG